MAEHSLTLKLPGNPEALRPRLAAALAQLDYVLLNDHPLQARRKARKLGSASTNVLNYSMDLTIGLKALGTEASEATFLYEWRTTWGAIGDKPTLSKEAEAIAALAQMHLKQTVCTGCGREQSAEAKFCRSCGQPLASTVPAELEMLKLMAAANAAAKSNSFHITVGAVVLLLLPIAVLLTKQAAIFFWFGLLMSFIFWISSLLSGSRLMDAIGAKFESAKELLAHDTTKPAALNPPAATRNELAALPSVTEDTTRLLAVPQHKAKEPVVVRKYDTGDMS